MSDLQELTNELMQDKDFKEEYESLQQEVNTMQVPVATRAMDGTTQTE